MRTRSGLLWRTNRRSGAPDEKGEHTASVTATDNHPFWVPELNEWLDATDLDKGNWLQTSAGTRVQIMAVERTTVLDATVHNLTVAGVHTYYVVASSAAVLVHNCDLHDLARSESAKSNSNQTAGAVARDSYTGEWAYGESGTTPVQVHPQLQQRLAALRSERGGSLEEWPAGQCAEFNACNNLLLQQPGVRLDEVEYATARRGSGDNYPSCDNCRFLLGGGGAREARN